MEKYGKLNEIFQGYHKVDKDHDRTMERMNEDIEIVNQSFELRKGAEIQKAIRAGTLDIHDCVKKLSQIDAVKILPCPQVYAHTPRLRNGIDQRNMNDNYTNIAMTGWLNSIDGDDGDDYWLSIDPGIKVQRDFANLKKGIIQGQTDTIINHNLYPTEKRMGKKQIELLKKHPIEIYKNLDFLYEVLGDDNGKLNFMPYNLDGKYTEGDEHLSREYHQTYNKKTLVNAFTVSGLSDNYYNKTLPLDQDVKKTLRDMLVENYSK